MKTELIKYMFKGKPEGKEEVTAVRKMLKIGMLIALVGGIGFSVLGSFVGGFMILGFLFIMLLIFFLIRNSRLRIEAKRLERICCSACGARHHYLAGKELPTNKVTYREIETGVTGQQTFLKMEIKSHCLKCGADTVFTVRLDTTYDKGRSAEELIEGYYLGTVKEIGA